jgi:hypothetical protein
MKNILLSITLLISVSTQAQYYYNDIIGTQEITAKMKAFIAAKVQSVIANGYDPRGAKTTDFNEWQDVQANGTILKVTSRDGQNANRVYYQFDTKTRLANTRDSSRDIESITAYGYDAKDNLVSVKTTTKDAGQDFSETEERQWVYTPQGKPGKMLRIINGKDSSEYQFSLDEKGNVADEQLTRRAVGADPVYYYYDDKNRVSDIVRYDKRVKKLLPDVMFEYDENNQIVQRTTMLSSKPPDYLVWQYLFNDKGLKTRESLYDKKKQLKGRIDYTYNFAP